jgi:L-ribulose-5-phosphate 3-epimerase
MYFKKQMMPAAISRRNFLINTALAGSIVPLIAEEAFSLNKMADSHVPPIHIFSKHLQFLNYKDMAEAAKEIGFDGIDLTVRPKGHVLPERIEDDLPLALEAMEKVGFSPLLMATAVESA